MGKKAKKGKKRGGGGGGGAGAAAAAAAAAGDFDGLMCLAHSALARFAYDEACDLMQQALRLRPTDTEALDLLGDVLLTYMGEEEKGRAALQHSINVAPDAGYVKYFSLAQLEGAQTGLQMYERGLVNIARELAAAVRGSEEERELRASAAQACCAVAELWTTDLCMEDGAEGRCEAAVGAALGHLPDGVEGHYLLAQLRLRQQRIDESRAALSRAVSLLGACSDDDLPSTEVRVELAKLLVQVDEWGAAYRVLKGILREDDGNGFVWYLLGECARRLGRPRRALRHLRRAKGIAQRVAAGAERDTADQDGGPADFLRKVGTLEAELVAEVGGAAAAGETGDGVTDSDEEREKEAELDRAVGGGEELLDDGDAEMA